METKSTPDKENYIELIRSRFACFSDIQQEIESFLKQTREASVLYERTSERLSSQLRDAQWRLESIKNFQETLKETDVNKLQPIFRRLEKAKSIARLATLTIQTNHELGLMGWNVGGNPYVNSMWAGVILPSFEMPARVTVVHEQSRCRLAFALYIFPERISVSVLQMEVPSNWTDPLSETLSRLNLFQHTNRLQLDGIEYELHNLTKESDSVICFSNPCISPFVEIKKAFFSIAEMVVNEKGRQAEKDYLTEWRRYIER